MSSVSTKQKLSSLVDDIELLFKELVEVIYMSKIPKTDGVESDQLVELLVQKNDELQKTLEIAKEQAKVQKQVDLLKAEVEKRDSTIRQLQRNLKEAETVLSNAIYQAKQKLQYIQQANNRPTSSEELIRFAHKISSSHAVAAPPTWAPGDARRPYPTDIEMRRGCLSGISDLSFKAASSTSADLQSNKPQTYLGMPSERLMSVSDITSWPVNSDMMERMAGGATAFSIPHDTSVSLAFSHHNNEHNKENDDVELMSTDSSSTSSSDE